MIRPGDIVTVDFPGVTGVKRRPAVVVSTDLYHRSRPDVVIGLLTSQIKVAAGPTDHVLADWAIVGLRRQSAFRAFLATLPATTVVFIGHLSDHDWQAVQGCVGRAIETPK